MSEVVYIKRGQLKYPIILANKIGRGVLPQARLTFLSIDSLLFVTTTNITS
jgi:hypothetical protein